MTLSYCAATVPEWAWCFLWDFGWCLSVNDYYKDETVLQSCKADGLLQVWSIEAGKVVSQINLSCQVGFILNVMFVLKYNLFISFPLRLIYVLITAVCGAPKIREISFSKWKGSANHKESSSVRKKKHLQEFNNYIDVKKMCILEKSADDHSPSSSLKDYKAVTLRFRFVDLIYDIMRL